MPWRVGILRLRRSLAALGSGFAQDDNGEVVFSRWAGSELGGFRANRYRSG
jgi:hypothetical protein